MEGTCAPFVRRFGVCAFNNIYICIGYILPTIWEIYASWIYVLVLEYILPTIGVYVSRRVYERPLGAGLGNVQCIVYIVQLVKYGVPQKNVPKQFVV